MKQAYGRVRDIWWSLVGSVDATVVDEEKQSEVSSSTCWSYIHVQEPDYITFIVPLL